MALFHGFSKMLIALGLEPDAMDTTVVPTPDTTGSPAPEVPGSGLASQVMSARPELAARWQRMAELLDELDSASVEAARAARRRLAQLLRVSDHDLEGAPTGDDPGHVPLAQAAAELFLIDVRAIDSGFRARLEDAFGPAGTVHLVMTLAVYDGLYRMVAVDA